MARDLPHDPTAANKRASENLDGAHARSASATTAMCRVRRDAAISQAVAASGYARQASVKRHTELARYLSIWGAGSVNHRHMMTVGPGG